jgi:uncharacterized protein YuzE
MRWHFDREADVLYVRVDDSPIVGSKEVHPGVALDFNADEQVVAIELRGLQHQFPAADLSRVEFDSASSNLAEQSVARPG